MGSLRLQRPPRNDDELYELVQTLWGLRIPRHKVCIDHQAPFDAFSHAFFARSPQVLIHGSRGLSGKSVLMSVLGITTAVVWGADCNILGGSLAQSNNVLEAMQRAWDHTDSPRFMLAKDHHNEQRLTNNARIRPLTASQKTVRGPHPARLLLDEIDEMQYPILQAALGQPMPQNNWLGVQIPAQTTMASTWQYSDGTFSQEYNRFKENQLPIFTWCFKDTSNPVDGWLSQELIEQKKREVPREMWRVEYELGEPSIGNRAFDSEAIEEMFDVGEPRPLKQTREHQEYLVLDYSIVRDYVIAADWARDMDWTVISVWDATETPIRLAYYVRLQRRPYPQMVGIFNVLQRRYRAQGIHDATGLGSVVSDYLDDKVRNFLMTGKQRDNMLSEYVSAVENHRVRASRIESMYSAHKYCSTDDLYSRKEEFHLPDEVCSSALAWKLVSHRFPITTPFVSGKADQNWMSKAVEQNRDWDYIGTRRDGEVVRKTEDEQLLRLS